MAQGDKVDTGHDYRDAPLEDLEGEEPGEASAAGAADERAWVVDAADHGLRLDKALVRHVPEFSRSHLQSLIERGCVSLDGCQTTTASFRLRWGQTVRVHLLPTAQAQAFHPERMVLDIRFEDPHLIVLNKPAGLVVHPAPGHWSGTLLNGLLAHHASAAQLPRAGIVHRLDRDTSGVMVVAKTLHAMNALMRAIAAREVQRVYRAVVWGTVGPDEQDFESPIGRDPASRIRMAVVATGKPSRTTVRVVHRSAKGPWAPYSALECRLHTGRTHQIRVHLAHAGHPLVADALYGGAPGLGLTRQALHALRLTFVHPVSGVWVDLDVPLPGDLAAAWDRLAPLR